MIWVSAGCLSRYRQEPQETWNMHALPLFAYHSPAFCVRFLLLDILQWPS